MPFQYQPSESRSALTIGDILRERGLMQARAAEQAGAIQARAAEQSGQAWAGAVQNIGQTVAAIPGQVQQQKRAAQQDEATGLQLDEHKQAAASRAAFMKVIKDTPQIDEDGTSLFDVASISKQLAAAGADPNLATHLNDLNQGFRAEKAAKLSLVKLGAEKVMAAGNDPTLAGVFLDQLEKNGTIPAALAAQYREFINADPGNVAKLTAYLAPQKMENAAPGSVSKNPITGQIVPGSKVEDDPSKGAYTGPDGIRYKADGTPLTGTVMKPQTSKGLQAEKFRLDGKDVNGTFNPETGAYQYQGQDVTGRAKPIPTATAGLTTGAVDNVKEAIAGMKDGTVPPQMPGRASKDYTAIMAEAHRQGYDLAGAATDWAATQKHIATMNGAQQLRLNQAINALPDMLDKVDALASQWKGGRFPILNNANLRLAKGGAYGKDVASIANQLDAQIADVTADLGNVYMGGNSPTDHALGLAGKSLNATWDAKVLHDMVKLAKANVTIRSNSIRNTGVAGASENNPYAPPAPAPAAGATIEAKDAQGNIHHAPAGTPLPAGWSLVQR